MQNEYLFTDEQWSIINGSLLGDAHISKSRYGKSYFCKPQCLAHGEYLEWHFDKLKPYSMSIKLYDNIAENKVYKRFNFRTESNQTFAELRNKWYPINKKIIPKDLKLDPLSIAVWFFDDGSNNIKQRTCKFATYCFTRKECEFLVEKLKDFQINCGVSKRNEILVRAESYKTLVNLVKPFMLWDCFKHKINYRDSELLFTTDEEAKFVFESYQIGKTQKQIAQEIGKSVSVISAILRGNRKKHLKLAKNLSGLSLSNTSGFTGISWDKERKQWLAYGKKDGKTVNFGRFNIKEEAVKTRIKWENEN